MVPHFTVQRGCLSGGGIKRVTIYYALVGLGDNQT